MKALVETVISGVFKIVGLFNDSKLVYFESFHGKQFSDNPKAIYQFMKNNYPEYRFVWGVTKGYEKPFLEEGVSYVSRFSLKWFFIMPRATAWVMNTRTPLWLTKSRKTTYIQTWHGTPLKKIGADITDVKIPGYTTESYRESFKNESKRWDYLVSPNAYCTPIFRQAFLYDGPILEVGYPRNDVLVTECTNTDRIARIKERVNVPLDKKVILYAPTWRETEKTTNHRYEFTIDFPYEELSQAYGEDMVLLVRMHYLVAQAFDFEVYGGQVINVSDYPDMSDLLLISDVLITDYSSCLFDYSLTGRPMIFYIPDKEEYDKELRGFYIPLDQIPSGKIVSTKSELLLAVSECMTQYDSIRPSDDNRFTSFETGTAAKQISEALLQR